ncbi:hypothetical protein B1P97_04625 [Enterococcus faecium]|nr:hypothetical protein B1P97_04625 [Enterococcus faecium]PZM70963.1 hypothetical protein DMB17_06630 [Enterococcus faecium]
MVVFSMNYILYVLLVVYAIIYIKQIVNAVSEITTINYLLTTIEKAINDLKRLNDHSGSYKSDPYFQNNVTPIREIMVKEMPRINKVLPYSLVTLSLNQSDDILEENFRIIASQIFDKNNEIHYRKFWFLNPLIALKKFFLLPSEILSWFGINLSTFPGRIFSLVIWVTSLFAQETISQILSFVITHFFKGQK